MTGKQLKNSILQLAIQGKLVPQDPHDEPASELLKRIRKEKEQLVKTGKLKKKDLESTPIAEDEKPFEIPESWVWCRLGEISLFCGGYAYKSTDFIEKSLYQVLRLGNVKNDFLKLETSPVFISSSVAALTDKYKSKENDILLTMTGTRKKRDYFYTYRVKSIDSTFYINQRVGVIRPVIGLLSSYLIHVLKSEPILKDVFQYETGTANQGNLGSENILKVLIPLPPLSEQHRIVEKIEELMPLVEEYDKAQSELDKLNESLPEQLKKSILQQAIMGKLVPQDPNDEPASELLKRIHKEKENLVKSGALKKKDLITTPISDDEKPFDIPESWEWVHLGDIFAHTNGKQLNRADTKGDYHDYITTSNLYWDRFDLKEVRQMLFTDDELIRCTATKGDLLVCEGGDIGRSAIWNEDYDICIQNHIHRVRAYSPLCTRYFLYLLMFNKAIGLIGGKGIGIQGFSAKALHNTLVALPPLSEQHRIVAKIEELFSILK